MAGYGLASNPSYNSRRMQRSLPVIASASEAIHRAAEKEAGLLRRIRLRPKAGFGGQEGSSQ